MCSLVSHYLSVHKWFMLLVVCIADDCRINEWTFVVSLIVPGLQNRNAQFGVCPRSFDPTLQKCNSIPLSSAGNLIMKSNAGSAVFSACFGCFTYDVLAEEEDWMNNSSNLTILL
jgi:hypothetical protein